MEAGIFVPLAFFAMIAAIVLGPRYFRNKERQDLQQTLRAAIDKGQPLPPEVIEAITKDTPTPRTRAARVRNDLRTGVVWLMVALGILTFGWVVYYYGEADNFAFAAGLACIPGFIGLALIALGIIDRMSGGRNADRELV